MSRKSSLKFVETLGFILAWGTVMLLGADFPPPAGFWKVIVGILILALVQWVYLDWLLENLTLKGLLVTLGLASGTGALTALVVALTSQVGLTPGFGLWMVIISGVATLYGLGLWTVNWLLGTWLKSC